MSFRIHTWILTLTLILNTIQHNSSYESVISNFNTTQCFQSSALPVDIGLDCSLGQQPRVDSITHYAPAMDTCLGSCSIGDRCDCCRQLAATADICRLEDSTDDHSSTCGSHGNANNNSNCVFPVSSRNFSTDNCVIFNQTGVRSSLWVEVEYSCVMDIPDGYALTAVNTYCSSATNQSRHPDPQDCANFCDTTPPCDFFALAFGWAGDNCYLYSGQCQDTSMLEHVYIFSRVNSTTTPNNIYSKTRGKMSRTGLYIAVAMVGVGLLVVIGAVILYYFMVKRKNDKERDQETYDM